MRLLLHPSVSLVLLISSVHLANSQSLDSALNFYPMHRGDYWQYDWNRFEIMRYYLYVEITGDTVMPNGLKYYEFAQAKLSETAVPCFYKRIDSSTACVFQWIPTLGTEYMVDSLRARMGDSFANSFVVWKYCWADGPDTVLGFPTHIKGFHGIAYNSPQERFAYGLGLYHTYCDDTLYGTEMSLLYATINGAQYGTPVSVGRTAPQPQQYQLFQNYPNPFNPSTTISFILPQESNVRIKVLDILGRTMTDIPVGRKPAGLNTVNWTADLPSGVYFYQLQAQSVSKPRNRFVQTKSMLLLK